MEQSVAFNISTIAKMVGSDLVEPMLVSYQENTQAQLTKLITIVATQSVSELHRLAHSMKSSQGSLVVMLCPNSVFNLR